MSDPTAPCVCGHEMTLTRELLDQAGRLVECPACGHELRVWQWFARANKRETHETNARNTH